VQNILYGLDRMIYIEAKDQEQAEELALEKANNDDDRYHWKYCGDYDLNYQVDESQEI
jgi:hypothetical protein